MTHVSFINTQAFGDSILGINAARRLKENNPDFLVSYSLRNSFNLTTNDGLQGLHEALEVLDKQPWLDAIGVVEFSSEGKITSLKFNKDIPELGKIDDLILHDKWYSDLGISRSTNVPIKKYLTDEQFEDGNTELFVESKKPQDGVLRIATAGPLDWNRKLQNETLRLDVMLGIKTKLLERNIPYEINLFGVEISDFSLYQALMHLNMHDIFIGPCGSLTHCSAALGLDTITIPSVFPASYDQPSYYSKKGNHISVNHRKENHCGDFKCVSEKPYEGENQEPNNPATNWGFWLRKCPYTESKWACTKTVQAEDVINAFERILDVRSE